MIFLITSFFVISPLVILYTAGYRYDRTEKHIKETGVITIDIEPRDAVVSLNTLVIDQGLPIHLPNRAPGIYKLELSRQGYIPWSMPIEVTSKQTTYITDIALYRDVLPTNEYTIPNTTASTILSPDGHYVTTITSEEGGMYEILLFDLDTREETILWRGTADDAPEIVWSPFAPLVTLHIARPTGFLIKFIDARTPSDASTYTLQTTTTPSMQWSETRKDILYVEDDEEIHVLSGGTSTVLGSVTSTHPWFVDASQTIWTLDEQHTLWRNAEKIQTFPDTLEPYTILGVTERYLLVKTVLDVHLLWLDSGEKTTIPASHIFRTAGERTVPGWIAWSAWEVYSITDSGTYSLLTRTNKPLADVRRSDIHASLLFLFADSIVGYHPHYRTSHILYETPTPLYSVAIDADSLYVVFDTAINGKRGIYKREL